MERNELRRLVLRGVEWGHVPIGFNNEQGAIHQLVVTSLALQKR